MNDLILINRYLIGVICPEWCPDCSPSQSHSAKHLISELGIWNLYDLGELNKVLYNISEEVITAQIMLLGHLHSFIQ